MADVCMKLATAARVGSILVHVEEGLGAAVTPPPFLLPQPIPELDAIELYRVIVEVPEGPGGAFIWRGIKEQERLDFEGQGWGFYPLDLSNDDLRTS